MDRLPVGGQIRSPPQQWGKTLAVQVGYALTGEEQTPNDLVRDARLAGEAGFTFALISDHDHPWIDAQGQSPFVCTVPRPREHTQGRRLYGVARRATTVRPLCGEGMIPAGRCASWAP
jgi:hypothetical protein